MVENILKYLVISVIILIFSACEDGSNSITVIYKVDCDDKLCICRGYSGAYEIKSISIFKCDSTSVVGDTIKTKSIL
jgi:hypothetical protein